MSNSAPLICIGGKELRRNAPGVGPGNAVESAPPLRKMARSLRTHVAKGYVRRRYAGGCHHDESIWYKRTKFATGRQEIVVSTQ